jgi:SAM-dependent methyltransferase
VTSRTIARKGARAVWRRLPRRQLRHVLPTPLLRVVQKVWLASLAAHPDPRTGVQEILRAYDEAYQWLNEAAIAYDGGVHVKHRLMRYHDFFVERIRPGERVLDVGCGKGELAFDLVERAGASVVGIDNDPVHLAFARTHFVHDRLEFVAGDATSALPAGQFDVVVLSNVLEHIEQRVDFLRRLAYAAAPERLLIRVPVLDRDWTVPLRREVGLPYFSDPGHHVEYDLDLLRSELSEAGLALTEHVLVWGEIWAAAEPAPGARA